MLLRNQIENVSRYADANTPVQLQLRAWHSTSGWQAELMVRDVGAGVAPEQLSRLTAAFTRLDSRGNGIGLGLNIVARVCALHQASLQFDNAEQPHGLRVRGASNWCLVPGVQRLAKWGSHVQREIWCISQCDGGSSRIVCADAQLS